MEDSDNIEQQPLPPPQIPIPIACVPLHLVDQLCAATAINERLRHQLERKQLAEEAYGNAVAFSDERIYTQGRGGAFLELCNHAVRSAFHVLPKPPSNLSPFYLIYFSGVETPLSLSEKVYLSDSGLLNAVQELPSVTVNIRRSTKTTATLLRQAISQHMQVLPLEFYAGWQKGASGAYHFNIFSNFSTHQMGMSALLPVENADMPTAAVMAVTAAQFWPAFEVVCNPDSRWMVFLLFHAAALCSLLQQLKQPLPLGLVIFYSGPEIQSFLERLFSWYGDGCLSLDIAPAEFSDGMLARKDQPALIRDSRRSKNAVANAAELEHILQHQRVLWRKGREKISLPLQALPVILTEGASSLTCSPDILVLDLVPDDFDRDRWLELAGRVGDNRDYLVAFVTFVQFHLPQLHNALEYGSKLARQLGDGRLSEKSLQALGALLGLECFLDEFFLFCAPAKPPILLFGTTQTAMLVGLLVETSEKGLWVSDLAEQFVSVARSLLMTGQLHPYPLSQEKVPPDDLTVYTSEDYLSFSSNAFTLVCQRLGQSRPTILRALVEADLILGRPVNGTTLMTRLSVWNAYGVRKTIAVYRLPRSAFDRPGDPLLLGEEEPL